MWRQPCVQCRGNQSSSSSSSSYTSRIGPVWSVPSPELQLFSPPFLQSLLVTERNGWRRVLSASKQRLSAKGEHPYRKRACLGARRVATTKLTQRGTGYPSWVHPTQLRTSRGSTGNQSTKCIGLISVVFVFFQLTSILLLNVFENGCWAQNFQSSFITKLRFWGKFQHFGRRYWINKKGRCAFLSIQSTWPYITRLLGDKFLIVIRRHQALS